MRRGKRSKRKDSLVLKSVGPNRGKVLFLIRDIFHLSLKEAKVLMDSAPVTLMEDIRYSSTATSALFHLKDAGATIEIEEEEVLDLNNTEPVITAYYRGTHI